MTDTTDWQAAPPANALAGRALCGNDFSASEIAAWFEDERGVTATGITAQMQPPQFLRRLMRRTNMQPLQSFMAIAGCLHGHGGMS